MEQKQQYHEDRHHGGVADQCLQPAWLCVPHIKVENDFGIYHCQSSEIGHLSTSNCSADFKPLECNSNYGKTAPMSAIQSECCVNRRPDNAIYMETDNLEQPSAAGLSSRGLCLDQPDTVLRYLPSEMPSGHNGSNMQIKDNKYLSAPWYLAPQQDSTHPVPENKLQLFHANQESDMTKDIRNGEVDECESRQAFDLTCRGKATSNEEASSNGSSLMVPEEHSGVQAQTKCSPKPQTCKICGKVLSSPSSYYVHMKLHSGNKPYACSVCEASFCRKPYLEVHMRTHTGERPFECHICNKRFTQKSSLNTHQRVHTGERPYSCDICQKTFAVKSYVTAHRWSHVSEKPLECQHCGLTFTSKNSYAIHSRTHTDQNHECNLCGRTFMKDSYLIRHQNRVHRDSSVPYSDSIIEPRSPEQSP